MDSSTNNDTSNVAANERLGRTSLCTLEFDDFVDLQTRLVLLPNQDDECIGAKIHSYIPKQSELDQQDAPPDINFVDLLLVDIDGCTQTENDWAKEDFTSILSAIRNTSKPIILHFIHPPPQAQSDQPSKCENNNCSTSYYDDSDSEDISEISMSSSEDVDLAGEIKNKLSRWGTKFADAAEKYASHAVQASKELAKDKANGIHERRITNLSQNHDKEKDISGKMNPPCALFLQTSNGKCVPLQEHHVRLNVKEDGIPRRNFFSKKPTVTNTSVLVIRKSAEISCPRIGFTYQWYRSYTMEQSLSNNDSTHSVEEWIEMDYETSAIYQPTTTDVGFRVKCIVSIKENDEETTEVVCELPFAVQCDKTLFDVAYKSFSPDNALDGFLLCSFDNMHGRDELQDIEKININLYTKRCSEKATQSGFHMVVNTKDCSPLGIEGEAISGVLTRAYGSAAKSFFLAFEDPLQEGTYIALKLDAPSRITRETFLIALGIARFDGDLKDLNTCTKLFPERPPLESDFSAPNYQSSIDDAATKEEVTHEILSVMETPEKATDTTQKSTLTPFNTKMMALESELEEDLGILRDKLESKNKVVSDLREELKLLKHENICSSEQISNLKGLLHLSEEKTKNLSESLEAEKNVKESYRTKLDDRSKQLEVSKLEFEKTIRSLENEKAVLTAAVEARDRKLDIFKELKHEVESLKQKLQEKEKECNKLMDLSKTNHHLKDQLNDSSTFQKALEDKLKQMDLERQTALNELQKEREISTQTKVELDKLKTLLQTMKGERNNFKQKADSLAKEMSRLRKSDLESRNYERLQHDYKKLQDEVTSLRSERRAIKDELEATQIAHAAYIEAQNQAGEDTDLIRSLSKCAELERVISDLTEYLHAKEMQLETVQSANRKLNEEFLMIQKKSYNDV